MMSFVIFTHGTQYTDAVPEEASTGSNSCSQSRCIQQFTVTAQKYFTGNSSSNNILRAIILLQRVIATVQLMEGYLAVRYVKWRYRDLFRSL